jgi:predicted TPR repeat methyltransferase
MLDNLENAIKMHQMGNYVGAEVIYRQLLKKNPQDAEVLHLLSILLAQQGNFDEAKKLIETALGYQESAVLHNSLGNVLKNISDFEGAISHYKKALKLDPKIISARVNLANIYYLQNQFEKALDFYHQALALDNKNQEALWGEILVLVAEEKNALALLKLDELLKENPYLSNAHSMKGQLLHQSDPEVALSHYYKALRYDRENLVAQQNLAEMLIVRGKFISAAKHYKKILQLDPNHQDALYNLGTLYLTQQQPEMALKYFLHLITLNKDIDVLYNLAVTYLDLGRLKDAIIYFEEAAKINPRSFQVQNNLGTIYLRLDNIPQAILHYREAVLIEPENQEIKYILASLSGNDEAKKFSRAPNEYLEHLFDQYAFRFDEHLKFLKYRVPDLIYDLFLKINPSPAKELLILDLGCGSGLCGEKFSNLAKYLIGIDLSLRMIQEAKRKNVYHELKIADIETALIDYRNFDLVIAADTLVYLGDLEKIMAGVAKSLHPEGLFIFTLENGDYYPYQLQKNARFAHHEKYLEELAKRHGFEIIAQDFAVLREEKNMEVKGVVYGFRKKT